jgi:hypothetical protein
MRAAVLQAHDEPLVVEDLEVVQPTTCAVIC